MALGTGLGVHVGGRVNGAEVDKGWELAVGLPQAERNRISNNTASKSFLLMEYLSFASPSNDCMK